MGANGKFTAQIVNWLKEEMGISEINEIKEVEIDEAGIWIRLDDESLKSLAVLDIDEKTEALFLPDKLE